MKNAIERLRELANGAAPGRTYVGLCCEMRRYKIYSVPILALGWSKHSGKKAIRYLLRAALIAHLLMNTRGAWIYGAVSKANCAGGYVLI